MLAQILFKCYFISVHPICKPFNKFSIQICLGKGDGKRREDGWGNMGEQEGNRRQGGKEEKREGRENCKVLGKAGWSRKKEKKLSIMRDEDLNRIKREGR